MGATFSGTEIWSFVELASYYRRFYQCFSTIIDPLTRFTHQSVGFQCSYECQESFQNIKNLLTSAVMLTPSKDGLEFIVYCNSSRVGLGGIFMQKVKVIGYASRMLKSLEKNYPTMIWS